MDQVRILPSEAAPEKVMVGPKLRRWLRVAAAIWLFVGLAFDFFAHNIQEVNAIIAQKSAIQVAQLDADFIFDGLLIIGFALGLYILSRVDE